MNEKFDNPRTAPTVGIVGLGTMGAMAAWQLAELGYQVTAFEAFWPGHNEGAGAGGSRMLRRIYAEGSSYGELVETSFLQWRRLEDLTGENIFYRTGGLSIGPREHPVLSGAIQDAETRNLPFEIIEAEQMALRFPHHRMLDGEAAFFDPEAGVLASNIGINAAVRAAKNAGARIEINTRVDEISEGAHGARVHVGGQWLDFDHVIVAGGPWTSALLPDLPLENRAIFHTWHLVTNRQLLRPERFPITLRRSGATQSYGAMSALDGSRVKIAPHFSYPRDIANLNELDRHVRIEWQQESYRLVTELFNGIEPGPVEAEIYPEAFTPDGHPAIGALDANSRLIVLAGFSGHGFKLAPGIGLAVADLIDSGSSLLLPAETRLDRDFTAEVSIRDLVLDSEPC